MKKVFIITLIILFIDQASKIYVKTHFYLYKSEEVFSWFKLTFVENPGMAYGFQFGGLLGKYFLVILRVLLIGGMIHFLKKNLKKRASNYLIIPMSMIFSGAIGNLIDGMFYGMIFDSGSVYEGSVNQWIGYDGVSQLTSFGNGYSHFMKGCVVDMFHFPLIDFTIPEDIPLIGNVRVEFFKYIFNVADSAITLGVIFLFLFRKKAFPRGLNF